MKILAIASEISPFDRKLRQVLALVHDKILSLQFDELLDDRVQMLYDLVEIAHYNHVGDEDALGIRRFVLVEA